MFFLRMNTLFIQRGWDTGALVHLAKVLPVLAAHVVGGACLLFAVGALYAAPLSERGGGSVCA